MVQTLGAWWEAATLPQSPSERLQLDEAVACHKRGAALPCSRPPAPHLIEGAQLLDGRRQLRVRLLPRHSRVALPAGEELADQALGGVSSAPHLRARARSNGSLEVGTLEPPGRAGRDVSLAVKKPSTAAINVT